MVNKKLRLLLVFHQEVDVSLGQVSEHIYHRQSDQSFEQIFLRDIIVDDTEHYLNNVTKISGFLKLI